MHSEGTTYLNGTYTNTNAYLNLNIICLKSKNNKKFGICHISLRTGSNIASFSNNPDTYIFKFPTGYTPALAGRVYLAPSTANYSVIGFF